MGVSSPVYDCNESTASWYVLNSGSEDAPLIYCFMFNNITNQDAANNSSNELTLIHETDTMSSLEIAKLVGKDHRHLLEAIRKMEEAWVQLGQPKFRLSSYKTMQNKELPCYYLTKTECLYIATKFADEARAKLVLRWEELEKKARQPKELSRKDLAIMVIKAEEEKERLQLENTKIKEENEQIKGENEIVKMQNEYQSEQLKQQAPKVEYVDKVLSSPTTYSTNLIAKEMGMSAVTLNRHLKEKGVQYKQGGVWILTHKYQNKGYTATRTSTYTRSDGTEGTSMLTVWTEKGRKFIHDLFAA